MLSRVGALSSRSVPALALLTVAALLCAPAVLRGGPGPAPAAARDGERIVYTRAQGEWPYDVYVSGPNGEDEVRITANADIPYDPRWSPDGSEIAFHVPREGAPVRILRVPWSGGTPTPMVMDDGRGYDAGFPAWHPSGECISYSGDHPSRDGRSDLKIWCANGTTRTVLVTDDRDEQSSDWTPDGLRLAVESQPIESARNDRSYWDIYVVAADGTGYAPLVAADYSSECDPRWSPDGDRLAFVTYGGRDCSGRGILRVLDLASGATTDLALHVSGPPTWSPDGRSLLVTGVADSGPEPGPGMAPPPTPVSPQEQRKGIYRVDLDAMAITRLGGAAGGVAGGGRMAWGFGPDWWGVPPAATPTPTTTPSPTPTATSTTTPTATPSGSSAWLPVALRLSPLLTPPPSATPEEDPTPSPSPETAVPPGTPGATGTSEPPVTPAAPATPAAP